MNFPKNLSYNKDHEWVQKKSDGAILLGISDYAQEQLGDIVFVNLPELGDVVTAGERFCDVESVKTVSDIISPVTGVIAAVNEELLDNPDLIRQDPYAAWFVEINEITAEDELLSAEEYEEFCKQEE